MSHPFRISSVVLAAALFVGSSNCGDEGPLQGAELCAAAADHLAVCFDAPTMADTATCDSEVANEILALECSSDPQFKTDGWFVSLDRWVWRQVANLYMRRRGLDLSAALLEHSLQDYPVDLVLTSVVAESIIASPEYKAYISAIPVGEYEWSNPVAIEFRSSPDLFSALQTVLISHRGSKSATDYEFDVHIFDNYDFHWQALEADSLFRFLATLGANAAYVDQLLGIIVPYSIELDFVDAQ